MASSFYRKAHDKFYFLKGNNEIQNKKINV